MSSKRADNKKTIVVVGGGHAGVHVCRNLSLSIDPAKYNLVLINPLPYRILLPPALRLIVSDADNLEPTALVPYDKLFHNGNGTFIQGTVTAIEQVPGAASGVVFLKNGEKLDYDVLVLTPGAAWEGPLAFPDTPQQVKDFIVASRERYAKSNDFVLAGGGAVGIELAGEIKDIWPRKNVTIVHSASQLLNETYPTKYRVAVEKSVRDRGINVVFDDTVDISQAPPDGVPIDGRVVTKNGKTLKADCIVKTWGARPNTAFISSLSPDVLTARGTIKIKSTFQIEKFPNVFAAGDIIEWKEQKQAAKAKTHGAIVAANVLAYLTGTSFKEYKGSVEMLALTNGKAGGVSYLGFLWGIVLGAWLTSLLKSKKLGVPYFRKEMGQAAA